MRTLTTAELYSKGIDAMESKDYIIAEKYFLATISEYDKKKDDFSSFISSFDLLSIYLYAEGKFENKEKALRFFKTFNKLPCKVAQGYAIALINGVFGNNDYKEAILQLSNVNSIDQHLILAKLLHEGKGFKKDDYKAALLLKSTFLWSTPTIEYIKLYKSIGIVIDLPYNELNAQVEIILYQIFDGNRLEDEDFPTGKDSLIVDFFEDKENIIDINILTDDELPTKKNETDFPFQVSQLHNLYLQEKYIREIFEKLSMTPLFNFNPKYYQFRYENMTPYITYNDLVSDKYIIRVRPSDIMDSIDNEEREIIVQYDSIKQMIGDGWTLDNEQILKDIFGDL
jgi:hypothetical protein